MPNFELIITKPPVKVNDKGNARPPLAPCIKGGLIKFMASRPKKRAFL